MSATTRDLGEVAGALTHVAYLLAEARDTIGELAAPVDVEVTIYGPTFEDLAPAMALVEQLAVVTGIPPTWQGKEGKYRWYRTELRGTEQLWTLRCTVYTVHPDGDLKSQNERLLARVAELEGQVAASTGPAEHDDNPPVFDPDWRDECGGGCPTS